MKRLLLIGLILAVSCIPVMAGEHNVAGAKIDAPNLVKFTDNLSLGLEAGKEIFNDLGYDDTLSYVESDKGYFGFVKITYSGSLFKFGKK